LDRSTIIDGVRYGRFINLESSHSGGQKSEANEDTDAPENKKQRLEEGKTYICKEVNIVSTSSCTSMRTVGLTFVTS